MTWTTAGSAGSTTGATLTAAPGASGNLIALAVISLSATVHPNGVTSSNGTWTLVASFAGTNNAYTIYWYQMVASSSSSATATITWSGTKPTTRAEFFPYHSSVGNWTFDHQATLDQPPGGGGTNTWPNPGGTAGDLSVGFAYNSNTSTLGTNGTPAGMVYTQDANGNGWAYDLNSQPTQPAVWGDFTQLFGSVITLREGAVESGPLSITLPKPTTSISGIAQQTITGPLSITLPKPTTNIVAIRNLTGEYGPLNIVLPRPQFSLGGGIAQRLAGTYKWNGSSWVPYQLGTDGIAALAVTANKIAANTITAQQIAANTITATQIAANTITGALIQAGTITGTLIAANTVAASNLVAGIVVAGVVDSTTINTATLTSAAIMGGVITGARIIADGTSGQVLIYSGTPASGNLIIALSGAAGTDNFSNPFGAGLEIISTGGSKMQLYDSGTAAVISGLSGAASESSPTTLSMAVFNQGLSNENIQMQLRGPESTFDNGAASVILSSSAADGSSGYTGTLEA